MPNAQPNAPSSSWRPPALYLLALFVLALAVRLAYFGEMRGTLLFETLLGPDAFFEGQAGALVASGDWSGPPHVFYHSPLYTYFLAFVYSLFGRDPWVIRILQAVLGSLACVFLAAAAARFARNERVAFLTGLLLALYPPAIFFDGLVKKTTLALFLLTLFLALLGRWSERPRLRTIFGAGLALGLLSLTRENARILLPLTAAWVWWSFQELTRAQRGRQIALLCAAWALVLLPVGLRNAAVGGEMVFGTTNMGTNLFIGNSAGADGLCQPLRRGRGHTANDRVDALELAQAATGRELSAREVSAYWRGRAFDFMRSAPLAWLGLTLRKSYYLFHAREWIDVQSFEVFRAESGVLRALAWPLRFGFVVPLAALGMVLAWSERRRLALWYAALALLSASVIVFFVFARFRMTLLPFLLFFAAWALVHGPRAWTCASRRARLLACTSTLALGIVLHLPIGVDEAPFATTWDKLGSALHRDGRDGEAIAAFEQAIELRPDYAPAHYNLGLVRLAQGDLAAGEAALETAVRLEPSYAPGAFIDRANGYLRQDRAREALALVREATVLAGGTPDAEAYALLGLIQRRLGDTAAAEEAYRRALAIRPTFADVHNNYGFLLAQAGRGREAREHYEAALRAEPVSVRALVNLASLLASDASVGRPAEAVDFAERAFALAPGDIQVHKALAMAHAGAGNREAAISAAQRVLELAEAAGDTQQAQLARTLLEAYLREQ